MGDKDRGLRNENIDLDSRDEEVEVEVLPMEESDLDEILRIEASSFSCPWTAEMFQHELSEAPFSSCWVAKERMGGMGGRPREVRGYICIWVVGEEMEIANLAVHPSWRRKGIGRTLLSRALGLGSQRQARRVFLEVRTSNLAAQRLYRGFGFEVIGVRKGYYRVPPEDAVVMALDLPGPWCAEPSKPKSS